MKKRNISIGVVITTISGREKMLMDCVNSVLANTVAADEIFIIAGKNSSLSLPARVKILRESLDSLSEKQNYAVQRLSSEVILFTDDDCIVSKDWIKSIKSAFIIHPSVGGIFGPVKAGFKQGENRRCPSIFVKTKNNIFDKPQVHQDIGSGNNMAFRREIFTMLGGFKNWLGSGTMVHSCGDAEMIVRMLGNGYKIMYLNSDNLVFHLRKLTDIQYQKFELEYLLGDTACYSYFIWIYPFAFKRVFNRWQINLWRYLHGIKKLLLGKKEESWHSIGYGLQETVVLCRGMIVGFYHGLIEI
ncbi:glycosyltransferase family 2 protein [Candidatus Gottesmanbacteria bacterium]|nr:glycosyltransferase family 2 protein [Candidatus Gottesmanbacteria bacterium]